ncbi:MAG: DUF349 domain-containing protein [Muribaculum sp.]|nr:DUF349 domain-containing protein [Muribaculum sp.]
MELRDQSSAEEVRRDITLTESANDTPIENAETNEAEPVVESELSVEAVADVDLPAKPLTKDEIVTALESISEKDGADINRDEVTRLKQAFYSLRKAELLQEKQEFLDKGNEEAAFAPMPDPVEQKIQELINLIKEKKAEFTAAQEAERKANLEKKLAIIEELTKMADDTDNVNRHYNRFRELSNEFKEVGEVPPTDMTDIWRNYQVAVERFYDQLKVNKDLRDYDFKKNLDQKQLLIDEAVKLGEEADVITAFRRLQELHEKWREIGPVAKELRDEIWNKFKDASAVVNKKYQTFFEARKARERENEEKKTAICERIEALDFSSIKSHTGWEQMTKEILAAQDEWKKLGFASKKVNNALFARFRKTCDEFFSKKAEYFKSIRENHSSNLAKKNALCERAEALKDSDDWRKAGDEFVAMQKEWKTIGPVDKRYSDQVWKRFLAACDYFFEQRKKATSGTRKTEQTNLKAKQEIIAALKAIDENVKREDAVKKVRELTAQWQQIGHVPFKDKDKVYDAYRAAVNELYDKLDIKESRANMANFANSIEEIGGDENRLYRERERLTRSYEQKRNELKTYENNLGFFNVKSKGGNSLLQDTERKMQRIKDDLAALQEKIKIIDSKL